MNFVILPMFFASSALYPLWRVREASPLLYYVPAQSIHRLLADAQLCS
jgi:hypothetical protein